MAEITFSSFVSVQLKFWRISKKEKKFWVTIHVVMSERNNIQVVKYHGLVELNIGLICHILQS